MKVSKNNFFISIYKGYYGVYPKSLCGFFWKTIFAIIMVLTSPIALVMTAIKPLRKKYPIFLFSLFDKVFILITLRLICDSKERMIQYKNFWWVYILVLVFMFFGVTILEYLGNLEYKPNKEKKPNIMVEAFKSIWSKVCPIVEVVDEENNLKDEYKNSSKN